MRIGLADFVSDCPAGTAYGPQDTGECISITDPGWQDYGMCLSPDAQALVPCPSGTTIDVTASDPSKIPTWVWWLSGGMIAFAFLKKGGR